MSESTNQRGKPIDFVGEPGPGAMINQNLPRSRPIGRQRNAVQVVIRP
jgi:hypothetical protein